MVTEENISKYRNNKAFLHFLLSFIILASGIAIGAGGTIMLVKQRVIWIGVSHPHKDANDITKEMSEKYGLNPQQTTQVQAITTNAFLKRKANNEAEDKRHEADIQTLIADMKTVLTPQQFEQWNKDFQAFRDKHKKPKN
ncbi:MAG: hypothetical protein ABR969_01850 [Sedimentisphaerales bacterium]|jgi:hypothetical protein